VKNGRKYVEIGQI